MYKNMLSADKVEFHALFTEMILFKIGSVVQDLGYIKIGALKEVRVK